MNDQHFNPDNINPSDLEKEVEKQRKLESEVKLLLSKNKSDKYSSIKGIINDNNIQRHTQLGFYQTKIKELYNEVITLSSKNTELVNELNNIHINNHNSGNVDNEKLLDIIKNLQEEKEKYKKQELENIKNNKLNNEQSKNEVTKTFEVKIKELESKNKELESKNKELENKNKELESKNKELNKSVNEPVNKPVNEPVNKPVNESVNNNLDTSVSNNDLIQKILLNESKTNNLIKSVLSSESVSSSQNVSSSESVSSSQNVASSENENIWKPRNKAPSGFLDVVKKSTKSSTSNNTPSTSNNTPSTSNNTPSLMRSKPIIQKNNQITNNDESNKKPHTQARRIIRSRL